MPLNFQKHYSKSDSHLIVPLIATKHIDCHIRTRSLTCLQLYDLNFNYTFCRFGFCCCLSPLVKLILPSYFHSLKMVGYDNVLSVWLYFTSAPPPPDTLLYRQGAWEAPRILGVIDSLHESARNDKDMMRQLGLPLV